MRSILVRCLKPLVIWPSSREREIQGHGSPGFANYARRYLAGTQSRCERRLNLACAMARLLRAVIPTLPRPVPLIRPDEQCRKSRRWTICCNRRSFIAENF